MTNSADYGNQGFCHFWHCDVCGVDVEGDADCNCYQQQYDEVRAQGGEND